MNKIYQKSLSGLKNAGFTLIELLVVVLIIGILAAVAFPKYQLAVDKSRYVSKMQFVDSVWQAQQLYYLANGTYAMRFEDLDIGIPAGLQHANSPGETSGNDRWVADWGEYGIRSDYGYGSYVSFRLNGRPGGSYNYANYLRHFRQNIPAKCYAGNERWDKVCLSLGGKLVNNTPGMHIYDLP